MNDRGLVGEIEELALLSSDILQDDRLISPQLSLLQNIRLFCTEADLDALKDVPYTTLKTFLVSSPSISTMSIALSSMSSTMPTTSTLSDSVTLAS